VDTTNLEQNQTATDLLLRAEHARRLARGVTDERAIDALNSLAHELEARAAAVESDPLFRRSGRR